MTRPRAVVTGGAGFLGSNLCRRLLDDGYRVLCVDDFSTGRAANIEPLIHRDDFELRVADVTEGLAVPGRVDAVLHSRPPRRRSTTRRCPSRR